MDLLVLTFGRTGSSSRIVFKLSRSIGQLKELYSSSEDLFLYGNGNLGITTDISKSNSNNGIYISNSD